MPKYTIPKAGITVGLIRLTLDTAAALEQRLEMGRSAGKSRKDAIVEVIEAGLSNLDAGKANQDLSDGIRELLRILIGARELDLEPHTCPRGVDPGWHHQREADRILGIYRSLSRTLEDLYTVAKKVEAAVKASR